MNRQNWKFPFPVSDVAAAAASKRNHHDARKLWWQQQQQALIAQVKAEGMEITESVASQYSVTSAAFAPQVNIKPEFQQKLNEAFTKIREHSTKEEEYRGWYEVLADQAGTIELDQQDWLYFFGGNQQESEEEQ